MESAPTGGAPASLRAQRQWLAAARGGQDQSTASV